MPTYTFTRTREQMRDMILRKLGALAAGETASAEDATLVYEAMDLRLKELHALQVLWFKVAGAQSDVSITGGAATASPATDVLYPESFAIRVNGEDAPVRIVTNAEFQAIPNKTDAGKPEVVLFSGSSFRFWPIPDINYTGKLTYQQAAADTEDGVAPDVQVSMMRSFCALVSYDLADDFGLPEQRIIRMKAQADEAMKTIKALNAERVDSSPVTAEYF